MTHQKNDQSTCVVFILLLQVTKGMDILERIYADYGDGPDFTRLPSQTAELAPGALYNGPIEGEIYSKGSSYLDDEFPLLSKILAADFIQVKGGKPVTVSIPHIDMHPEHIKDWHGEL
jgi:hypothetical protein